MEDVTTQQQVPQQPRRRRWLRRLAMAVAFVAVFVIGIVIGSAGSTTKTVNKPVYVAVPSPSPSPVTVTVTPPPPPPATTIATFRGSGNANTGTFTVPDSGNYVVSWSYSGNSTGSGGDNFSISETSGGGFGDLPNDIAVSGHGSTEVTNASGTDSFNVQADASCSWTITVKSAA